ncbi:MAG: hypothetical protein SVK44_05985, partial [Nitrospirota bacterium]|nr:hypothetical protein [Nitrospirota bacterium]
MFRVFSVRIDSDEGRLALIFCPFVDHVPTKIVGIREQLNLPTAKAGEFPFLLRCRLPGSLAYWVQGRFMRPARWSIK